MENDANYKSIDKQSNNDSNNTYVNNDSTLLLPSNITNSNISPTKNPKKTPILKIPPISNTPNNTHILTHQESQHLLTQLTTLRNTLRQKRRRFRDDSRLFCCSCFSICILSFIFVFYMFDVLKYDEACSKSKKIKVEICDAPSIGFWPRFILICISAIFLLLGVYCTGPTVVIFEPKNNKISINKKKFFCLPSVCEYPLKELNYACIESDSFHSSMNNLSSFNFYSVTLVFKGKGKLVNLGLGRDCFLLQEKIELVNDINKYLNAINVEEDEVDIV